MPALAWHETIVTLRIAFGQLNFAIRGMGSFDAENCLNAFPRLEFSITSGPLNPPGVLLFRCKLECWVGPRFCRRAALLG
jgi:hypothetical protein